MMTNRTIVTIQYILKYYDIQHSPPPQVNAFVAKVSDKQTAALTVLIIINGLGNSEYSKTLPVLF